MKVIRPFMDKFTRVSYSRGDKYEGTVERMAFLQQAGYLEDAPLPPQEPEEIVDQNAYQLMSKKELFIELDAKGIEYNKRQSKDELVALLKGE
jgi:hypothetical protein